MPMPMPMPMPIPMPMLSDFALRLAGGMAGTLLITPSRDVPLTFFRTHCLVILGLLVLAALAMATGRPALDQATWAIIAAGTLAFLGSAAWGLGVVRVALPMTLVVAATAGGLLVDASRAAPVAEWAQGAATRLASAGLLGTTLTAMLLGHHYLTAPAMSIVPLRRFVRGMAWALGLRALLAAIGAALWALDRDSAAAATTLTLAVRWGMGIGGPALSAYMTWETVKIRSTQSATGILYIAMTLVLFGELTGMVLSRGVGYQL